MKKAIFVIFVILLALYAGCSTTDREDIVIAKVEDREITIRDFESTVRQIDETYLPDTNNLEGKKKILDYIIARDVMLLRIRDLGMEKDEEFRSFWDHYRDPFLVEAIVKHYINDMIEVDEEEVDDYYEKMKNEYVVSQLTVMDSTQAERLREKILNGADFAELARRHSIHESARFGGRVGTVSIGNMFWWIEEALLEAEKGEITPVVKVERGWSILKVHDRRKILPDYDKEYAWRRVAKIKEKKLLMEIKLKMLDEMKFQIFPDVLTIAYNSLPEDIPMGDIFNRKVTFSNAPKLNLRDEYRGMILCQYDGNAYTLDDFEYIYENLGLPERPRREQEKAGIVDLMQKKFFNDVLPVYAEKRLKLLENPNVRRELDSKKEQFLLSMLYNRAIRQEVNVSEKEIDIYYDEHKDEITTEEKREYLIIINSDREIIEEVKRLADGGQDFKTLVKNYSEDPLAERDGGNKGLNVKGTYPEFDEVAFSLPEEGAISDPFETNRGWAIIKLETILEAGPLGERESKRIIRQKLSNERINEMFDRKVAQWRKKYKIEIYEENLAKAKLDRLKKD